MYQSTTKEQLIELADIPQSSVGAPLPIVFTNEHNLAIAFYLEDFSHKSDGTTIKIIDFLSSGEPIAIVIFNHCYAHYLGPPNDEAFEGHPLEKIGLEPYANYEVLHSPWIASLQQMNSVHPHHNASRFPENKRHFILAFHDSVFECIAKDYTVHATKGSLEKAAKEMVKLVL